MAVVFIFIYAVLGLKTSLAQIPSDLVISPDPLQFSDTALVSLDVSSPFNDVWLIDITINGAPVAFVNAGLPPDPTQIITTTLFSPYIGRSSVSASASQVVSGGDLTITFQLFNISVFDNNTGIQFRINGNVTEIRNSVLIIPPDCPIPSNIFPLTIITEDNSIASGTPGTFVCADSRTLFNGDRIATNGATFCTRFGTWQGIDTAMCLTVCAIPENIHPLVINTNSIASGSRGTFACAGTGSRLFRGGTIATDDATFCSSSGMWQGIDTIACLADCPFPENIHPLVINTDSIASGSRGTFACAGTGSRLFRGGMVATDDTTFCTSSGTWQGINTIMCLADCPFPENIHPLVINTDSIAYGSRGTFACASTGSRLFRGGMVATNGSTFCTSSGTWQGIDTITCLSDCPIPEGIHPLTVNSDSTVSGSRGTFACSDPESRLFFGDMIATNDTTFCNRSGSWQDIDTARCLRAPNVSLMIVNLGPTLALTCNLPADIPQRSIFYIGGHGFEENSNMHFFTGFSHDLFGTSVSCQAITPYTRVFNATGRSESVPFIQFEEPNQNRITCSWRLGQSEVCNVTFRAQPQVEYLALGKNGSRVVNDGSDTISLNGTAMHEYVFRRSQVSVEDYGEYRLAIRYVTFPGIRYVIFFDIEQEPLPNITANSCIWFVGQQGVCDVTIGMMGANVVSLLYDGEEIESENFSAISGGIFHYNVPQVITSEHEGNYSLTVRFPSTEVQTISFEIFVREYPFNSAAVIGITLAVLVLILVAFAVLACSIRKNPKNKNGEVELVAKKPAYRGTNPQSPPAANPTQGTLASKTS